MFVYGPVPSRRLGRSLGVSPIPAKTCSYSCVYCQLGRTSSFQTRRESFYPKDDILREIVNCGRNTEADYVTFVGDGEPTLCQDLGWLIQQTKNELHLPVAVITNGSLLFREDVRLDLTEADVVMPTLDAGNERIFRQVNRPHKEISFAAMIKGQIEFRQQYPGQVWLEVMLVDGLNDADEELQHIKHYVSMTKPDRVYITTPVRPPAESWVRPPDLMTVLKAQHIIGGAIPLTDCESGEFAITSFSNAEQAILEIGSRHPLRHTQAIDIEKAFNAQGTVNRMIARKKLIEVQYHDEEYLLPRHFKRVS